MVVSLVKGQRMSFAKENPGLRNIILTVQWNVKGSTGPVVRELDIDMSAFLLDQTGKCKGDSDIVFYGNTSGRKGAVVHNGKQQRGALVGEGLKVELSTMPMDVETVAVTLSIYEAGQRQQDFSMIQSLSASVSDGIKGSEICRFDVNWNFTIETAIVLCELYKKNGEWRFNAVGAGYQGGLSALCKSFGLEVDGEEGNSTQQVIVAPPIQQAPVIPAPPAPRPVNHMPPPPPPTPATVNHMPPPPPPPRRLMNEPLATGNAGVRIGASRQINLSNPQTQVNLNSSGNSGVSGSPPPAPRKFNFSPQNMGMAGPTAMPPSVPAHQVASNVSRCRCGVELKSDAKFCTGCGTPVSQQSPPPIPQGTPGVQYCTNCRNTLRPGSKFCTGCGKPT